MCAIEGSSSCFTEFQPIRFPSIENFHKLLFLFLGQSVCFFFTGPLVISVAGYIQSFRTLSFFIILDDHPNIRLIFQKGVKLIPNFELESFHFTLIQALNESCVYHVGCGNFKIIMNIFCVDADSRCDYRSNVDFVHFVWEHYERYPIKKFAITILLRDNAPIPLRLEGTRLLFLKHYRALSEGWWKDRDNCVECVANFHISLTIVSACQQPADDCLCIVCRRQPPSLRDLCSNAYFHTLQHFELNANTIFQRYMYAVNSGLVCTSKLIPPNFPTIQLIFYYDTFETNIHSDCPVER